MKLAPTMGDLWHFAKEFSNPSIDEVCELVNYDQSQVGENIEALLSQCKTALDFLEDGSNSELICKFVNSAEEMILKSCNFLDDSPGLSIHREFLRRIARRPTTKNRAKIFTTNYDKCFEYAGIESGFTIIDGFTFSPPCTFDSNFFNYDIVRKSPTRADFELIGNVFKLYKIHGSVDWELCCNNKIIKSNHPSSPVMIYPRKNKYELAFSQPFLEMMSAFQSSLNEPNTGLIISGFGFKDNHLAEPIVSAIQKNINLKVAICDPALMTRGPAAPYGNDTINSNKYLSTISNMLNHGDTRICFINAVFSELMILP